MRNNGNTYAMKLFWMSKDKKLGGIYHNYSPIANDQHILTSTTLPHRRRKQIMVWESYVSYSLQREYALSAWSSRQKLGLIKGGCSIPWGHVGFYLAAVNLWATGWEVGLGVKLQDRFCVIRGSKGTPRLHYARFWYPGRVVDSWLDHYVREF